mmetsp:Transcript_1627/g.2583  ORF Transcript_1627/g.2583 Transcript_1627/m.2583 type:complete len:318 (-) Transcript_1627:91-1044(-)|eukprot:CAMPEP_0185039370 /NCGR_PEP_ID=MMETSP1103-20130426/36173_1 /TAXON_ID=36769 /ORGANISM="Paraphysomonas bandaiensis, Strain Caron Lab Isolate" /LENGTH=317 /DNA_ID=CAMNT_0027578231 /DNA_START=164 /DNA_END=1117 /DNA_ORIENTATION=-
MNTITDREKYLFLARLAEQVERYDVMASNMKKLARCDVEFSPQERGLFSTAFKNLIGPKRSAWRVLNDSMSAQEDGDYQKLVLECKRTIEEEIETICQDVLSTCGYLLHTVTTTEGRVCLLKLKGDYYRYLAEFKTGMAFSEAVDSAHDAYMSAFTLAEKSLCKMNHVRLGLALNLSVFYFEIVRDCQKACRIANTAYDGALEDVDMHPERLGKDSALILQLLRDNIKLWTEVGMRTPLSPAGDEPSATSPSPTAHGRASTSTEPILVDSPRSPVLHSTMGATPVPNHYSAGRRKSGSTTSPGKSTIYKTVSQRSQG